MTLPTPLFDDSFSFLLDEVCRILGDGATAQSVVLRDATGQLTYFFDGELEEGQTTALEAALRSRLGSYARHDRVVADKKTPWATYIFAQTNCQWLPYQGKRVRYLDRRIVGVDWLTGPPDSEEKKPPRFVFASLKGGVGRTTALCVAAYELSRQGKNVLVIDLDLEAPGLGSMLLSPAAVPKLGVIDYLTECLLVSREQLSALVPALRATSNLPGHSGRVDVVPALGSHTRPENYLGKLARALLDAGVDGSSLAVRVKLAQLIDDLTNDGSYDAVLIDSRAGLAELSAGPFLALSATVYLFGTAQRQTLEGYRLLFAQLASLISPESNSPWGNLCVVLAKATDNRDLHDWFREELYGLFLEYLYEEQEGLDGFNFSAEDRTAPHFPVPIALNPLFADWDPQRRPSDLTADFSESSFRPFLDDISRRIKDQEI